MKNIDFIKFTKEHLFMRKDKFKLLDTFSHEFNSMITDPELNMRIEYYTFSSLDENDQIFFHMAEVKNDIVTKVVDIPDNIETDHFQCSVSFLNSQESIEWTGL